MSYTKKQLVQAYKDLRRSRKYIKNNWITGAYGIERSGTFDYNRLGSNESLDRADKVCSLGALGKVAHVNGFEAGRRTSAAFLACSIKKACKELDNPSPYADIIVTYNDVVSKGDNTVVLMAWDDAIKTVRGALVGMIRKPDEKDSHG